MQFVKLNNGRIKKLYIYRYINPNISYYVYFTNKNKVYLDENFKIINKQLPFLYKINCFIKMTSKLTKV